MKYLSLDVIITIGGGIIAFSKWVYEYTKRNTWDKNKYLVDSVNEFRKKEAVRCCEKMLDWNAIKFQYNGIIVKTTDIEIYHALQIHSIKDEFKPQEVLIREIFDMYFDELTKLVILVDCGLISEKNLDRFLGYWFDILNGNKQSKSEILVEQFFIYMEFYDYFELLEFLKKRIQYT